MVRKYHGVEISRRCSKKINLLKISLLAMFCILWIFIGSAYGSQSNVLMFNDNSGIIKATIAPDKSDGIVCMGCCGAILLIDGKEIDVVIQSHQNGKARLSGNFRGIKDGRHKAVLKILDLDNNVMDSMDILFVVDTRPPRLELVAPKKSGLVRTQTSFLVKCTDEGSGFPSTIEKMGIEVSLNGKDAQTAISSGTSLDRLLVISKENAWDYGERGILYVRLKDRAGNVAELNKIFKVFQEIKERYERGDCEGYAYAEDFLVQHSVLFSLPFGPRNIKQGLKPITIECRLPRDRYAKKFEKFALSSIQLTGNHPSVHIAKHTMLDSSAVKFTVSQTEFANPEDCICELKLEYLDAFSINREDICKVYPGYDMSYLHPVMRQYAIPVFLYWEGKWSDEILVQEEVLKYRFVSDKKMALDTFASWFEVDGRARSWIKEKEDNVYEASIPSEEGNHSWDVSLFSIVGTWGALSEGEEVTDGGTCLNKGGNVFVRLDPPLIKNFYYDRDRGRFWAIIRDHGTKIKDLEVKLQVENESEINVFVDPSTGAVEAPYPLPIGIQNATLMVTDLADQTTSKACRVFGIPTEEEQNDMGHGKHPITVKVNTMIQKNRLSWRHKERKYTGDYDDGKEHIIECRKERRWVLDRNNPYMSCLKRLWAKEGLSWNEDPLLVPAIKDYSEDQKSRLSWGMDECREKYGQGYRQKWEFVTVMTDCKDLWLDTFAPRIMDMTFESGGGKVTATIDDHGMPLSDLDISFAWLDALKYPYVAGMARTSDYLFNLSHSFSFDTNTGQFTGSLDRMKESERFNVGIRAVDLAGNNGYGWLDITRPMKPPDVHLMITPGETVTPFPVGECWDISGIDHSQTVLWLDGCKLSPFSVDEGKNDMWDRVYFRPVVEEGQHTARLRVVDNVGLFSEVEEVFTVSYPPKITNFLALPTSLQRAGGPALSATVRDSGKDLRKEGLHLDIDGNAVEHDKYYYDPESGYFSIDGPLELSPGLHKAHIIATDDHGNSAEDWLYFTPGEEIFAGGRVQGDIRLESITIWELEHHNGDGKTNPGERIRLFVELRNKGEIPLENVNARLESEEILVNVEKNQVYYGNIKEKEISVPVKGFDVLISEDIFDAILTDPYEAPLKLEVTDARNKTWAIPFSLPIYMPTIPSRAHPEEHSDEPAQSIVTVELGELPPSTSEEEIEITGTATSSASEIDRVEVFINGVICESNWDPEEGRFTSTVPLQIGPNVIEVESTDFTGAFGVDSDFINRTDPYIPPSLTIMSPIEGQLVTCYSGGACELTGTVDAGSSEIDSINASMTGHGDTVSISVFLDESQESFSSGGNIEFPFSWYNTDVELTVVMVTTDGDVVTETVNFAYECLN